MEWKLPFWIANDNALLPSLSTSSMFTFDSNNLRNCLISPDLNVLKFICIMKSVLSSIHNCKSWSHSPETSLLNIKGHFLNYGWNRLPLYYMGSHLNLWQYVIACDLSFRTHNNNNNNKIYHLKLSYVTGSNFSHLYTYSYYLPSWDLQFLDCLKFFRNWNQMLRFFNFSEKNNLP